MRYCNLWWCIHCYIYGVVYIPCTIIYTLHQRPIYSTYIRTYLPVAVSSSTANSMPVPLIGSAVQQKQSHTLCINKLLMVRTHTGTQLIPCMLLLLCIHPHEYVRTCAYLAESPWPGYKLSLIAPIGPHSHSSEGTPSQRCLLRLLPNLLPCWQKWLCSGLHVRIAIGDILVFKHLDMVDPFHMDHFKVGRSRVRPTLHLSHAPANCGSKPV